MFSDSKTPKIIKIRNVEAEKNRTTVLIFFALERQFYLKVPPLEPSPSPTLEINLNLRVLHLHLGFVEVGFGGRHEVGRRRAKSASPPWPSRRAI